MRLDVVQGNTGGLAKGLQGTNLVEHVGADFLRRGIHYPPPEANQVGERRMRADSDALFRQRMDRALHRPRIAGVEPAGNIGAGDKREEVIVRTMPERAIALANIAVDVDRESSTHLILS